MVQERPKWKCQKKLKMVVTVCLFTFPYVGFSLSKLDIENIKSFGRMLVEWYRTSCINRRRKHTRLTNHNAINSVTDTHNVLIQIRTTGILTAGKFPSVFKDNKFIKGTV